MRAAFGRVTRWPVEDLFPRFARETICTSAETLTFHR